MTQAELARKIKTRRQHINAIIRGRRRPGVDMAIKLAEITGTDLETWLTGTEEQRRAAVDGA